MHENPLNSYRKQLDQLDEQIVELIGRRFGICQEVARVKKAEGILMMQPDRVEAVKQKAVERARACGVDEEFITRLYRLIIDEACRLENDIIEMS
jgi:chorismate mutase-like protein